MLEFVKGALPWVAIGVAVIICLMNSKKKTQKVQEKKSKMAPTKEKEEDNYMTTGMCIGMGIGMVFGQMLYKNLATGMTMGMCLGMAIGSSIPKEVQ